MKKFFLVAAGVCIAATSMAKGDNDLSSHISLGPVLSLGHSWTTNVGGNTDFKFAPGAGLGLVYSRNVHWGFGAQLLVSHEGYRQELTMANNDRLDVTVNPVYLRMPLSVIYFFGKYGDRVRPKLYVGPSFAARVDEKRWYSDEAMAPVAEGAVNSFDRFDAGLSAGAGANLRLGRETWLNLDLGYYHGLTDAVSGTSDFNGNRNLRLNIGLMWGL